MPGAREEISSRPAMLDQVVEAQPRVTEGCPYNSHGLHRTRVQQRSLHLQAASNADTSLETTRLFLRALFGGSHEWAQKGRGTDAGMSAHRVPPPSCAEKKVGEQAYFLVLMNVYLHAYLYHSVLHSIGVASSSARHFGSSLLHVRVGKE